MTNRYTDNQRQISYRSSTTGIIADVRDIIEIDPLDDTKLKVKTPYIIATTDAVIPSDIKTKSLSVPVTSGIVHNIPAGFTYWIGVKDNGGTPLYNFHFTLEEFDLTEFAIIGRAFTDETVPLQLNGVTGTFWWEGWNYGKTLYDFATARNLSFDTGNGGITPDAGLLTYTREEGTYWRFMSYNDLKNPNEGTDPQTAITAYFTYPSVGEFEQTSTFEVGFFEDSGVKTAVPANRWSIYKIFHFASSNFESAQRGKQTYDSLHDAKSRKGEEDLPLNSDLENAAFTHIAYVKSGATDLDNSEEVVFEKINPNSLSSGGDPIVSSLQGSGLIDWIGSDILTINTDTTKFDTGQFRVGFVDRTSGEVKFLRTVSPISAIAVTNLTSDPFTYLGYNISTDTIIQQAAPMARGTLDNIIPLGRLWHRNKTVIDLAQTMPLVVETSHDYAGQLLAFGALKQSGLGVSENGANKKIDLATGVMEVLGGTSTSRENISNAQPTAATPLNFTPVHRAVTTAKAVFETITSDIDFDVFDDGSGTLATISPNKFGIHYFYMFPFRTTVDVFLVRGGKEYSTLTDAQEGLQQDAPPIPSDLGSGFLISSVLAKKGTTDLTSAISAEDAVIVSPGRFGSFGAGGGGGGGVAGASGVDGSIQFATAGSLNSDASNISWDDSLDVFTLGKTTSGQVAEFGNSILRNRGANDWALKHKLFTAAIDDNVGFGNNQGGKITIGATLNNIIEFLTGDGVTAPTVKVQILDNGDLVVSGTISTVATADGIIAIGEVLTFSPTTDSRLIRTTTASNEAVLGVAVTAASAAGSTFQMAAGGEFGIIINNTVTRGDFLESSSVAGRAQSSGTVGGSGDFAVAMQSGTIGQTIKARFKKGEVF